MWLHQMAEKKSTDIKQIDFNQSDPSPSWRGRGQFNISLDVQLCY